MVGGFFKRIQLIVCLCVGLCASLAVRADAQTSQWTWMGGSSTIPVTCSGTVCGQPGWYGTLRTAAAANMPAARSDAMTWTDTFGNLWLFGGYAPQGFLGDLWEFSPATSEWTWVAGSSSGATAFSGGPAGVYGTLGTPAASNMPGPRALATGWTDSQGNLWLFGGNGYDSTGYLGPLNDLWKFTPSTKEWTWMGGNATLYCSSAGCSAQPGVYGTLGTSAAGDYPGGRFAAASWLDPKGNFWIYGGYGADSKGNPNGIGCYPNDLWEYSPSSGVWTWMGGNDVCPNAGGGWPATFGSVGLFATGNMPWSLEYGSSWTDNNGNLWLFGGQGEDQVGDGAILNDMWEFEPSANEWALMSANSASDGGSGYGDYGTLGAPSATNLPGERVSAATWKDSQGNFWMFGGAALSSAFQYGGFLPFPDDLWEFNPSTNEWTWMGGSNTVVCLTTSSGICINSGQLGTYGTLGTPAVANTPGGRQAAATWTDNKGNLWIFGGEGFDAESTFGYLNDMWEYSLSGSLTGAAAFPATPTPTISLAAGTYTSSQSVSLADESAGAVIYYTTNGTAPNSNSAVYSGPITVSTTETIEAIAVAENSSASAVASAEYTIALPQATAPVFSVAAGTYTSAQNVTLTDATPGTTIYYTLNGTAPTTASTVYSGAITVSATETIEAIAVATGYANSTVASAEYTINLPPTFTMQASASSLTVAAGGTASDTITVTPENGFNSTVTFSCSGEPANVACSFNPATITTSQDASTVFVVSASALSTEHRSGVGWDLRLATLCVVCLFGWKRRRLPPALLLVMAFISLGLVSGCGGASGGGGSGTNPVTSTVTITATSAAIQQTMTVSVTVN